MKLITKFKSKNFDNRRVNKILYVIIHYTALNNCNEALEYLCDLNNKVSSHYLISNKGEVYYLVDEKKRAWHAGISFWKGNKDINSSSIGIELDFNPENNKYYNRYILESLIKLIEKIKRKYNIKSENILGHSDVAPYRKIDPGQTFPWNKLHLKKISRLPNQISPSDLKKIDIILDRHVNKSIKKRSLYMLEKIGYNIEPALKKLKNYNTLIKAYQMHYVKKAKLGKLDIVTYKAIKSHFIQLLTIE